MKNFLENKVIRNKKLDKETVLKVSKNEAGGRIFVEFSTIAGKFVVQKSFQDTVEGREEAKEFSKRIKNIRDLKKYFGVK